MVVVVRGVNYTTGSEQYDQVCGRIIGYQLGFPESFLASRGWLINSVYVEGVSVTHGSPRQHIWTFACGVDETTRYAGNCHCVTGSHIERYIQYYIPSFVGQNYFCETGVNILFPDGDPL